MANYDGNLDELHEKDEIATLKMDPKMDDFRKRTMIVETTKSFSQKKQSSAKTVFSITNTMVGSSTIVMPLNFWRTGFGSSMIAAILMAIVSDLTCETVVKHIRTEEKDYLQTIERIMGKGWKLLYWMSSQVILWSASIIYFLLLCNIFYSVLIQLIASHTFPSKDVVTYSEFSFQYIGIIFGFILFLTMNLKSIKPLLKASSYGIYCLGVYIVFLFFLAFNSIANGKVSFQSSGEYNIDSMVFMTCGSKSVLQALGIFTLSFLIHNVISPIVKNNQNQKNNQRDTRIAYSLTCFCFLAIGFVGDMGIFWREVTISGQVINAQNANTIMDLFDGSNHLILVFLIITELVLCCQILSVLPILCFFARTQVLEYVYGANGIPSKWLFNLLNVLLLSVLLLCQTFNFKPLEMIVYAGTFGGFVIIYLGPISVHLYSAYLVHQEIKKNGGRIGSKDLTDEDDDDIVPTEAEVITSHKRSLLEKQSSAEKERKRTLAQSLAEMKKKNLKMSYAAIIFEQQAASKYPLWCQFTFYGVLLCYGVFLIFVTFADVDCPFQESQIV